MIAKLIGPCPSFAVDPSSADTMPPMGIVVMISAMNNPVNRPFLFS